MYLGLGSGWAVPAVLLACLEHNKQIMARLPGASNQQTRHARRLYIGACPKTTEEEMTQFFNEVINRALRVPIEGGAVASVYVSQDKVRGWAVDGGLPVVYLGGVMLWVAWLWGEGVMHERVGCWRGAAWRSLIA